MVSLALEDKRHHCLYGTVKYFNVNQLDDLNKTPCFCLGLEKGI